MFVHVSVILFTGGGVCPIACWDTPPPPSGTRGRHPPQDQRQAPPGTRGRHPPWEQTSPPGADPPAQCMLGDMGNKQAVRILLEGNLVTPVCHSVHRGGVCIGGDLHSGGLPPGERRVGQTPLEYYGIWSTSGQYASYWNTFLI